MSTETNSRTALSYSDAFATFFRLRLRTQQTSVKLCWVYLAPTLTWDRPTPVSIGATAKVLDIKTSTVGRALAALVALNLLRCISPAGRNAAGWYVLGSAADGSHPSKGSW